MKPQSLIKVLVPSAVLLFSGANLARTLERWSLALFVLSLIALVSLVISSLFRRRKSGKSGLPARYERVRDPWRAMDKGLDPTE